MSQPEADDGDDFWAKAQAHGTAQAIALKEQAGKGGLRFEAYLPPDLAVWLLGLIERGTFTDPSEATFVILDEHQELEPHADLCGGGCGRRPMIRAKPIPPKTWRRSSRKCGQSHGKNPPFGKAQSLRMNRSRDPAHRPPVWAQASGR